MDANYSADDPLGRALHYLAERCQERATELARENDELEAMAAEPDPPAQPAAKLKCLVCRQGFDGSRYQQERAAAGHSVVCSPTCRGKRGYWRDDAEGK